MKTLTALLAAGLLALPVASAHAGHWCRGGDPPVYASDRTSCPFAARVYSKYASRYAPDRRGVMWVWSPTTHNTYRVSYRRGNRNIVVFRGRAGTGIYVRARWAPHG